MHSTQLAQEQCSVQVCALSSAELAQLLPAVPGWAVNHGALEKTYNFRNYYETMAFVNALAWVSHQQDHHPDLCVHYNRCTVRWNTHSAGGITRNDFVCAARADSLLPPPA
jgi:4a-hydroxytetrahydrobiopterin dehydratase